MRHSPDDPEIRSLSSVEDFQHALEVQKRGWGFADKELLPVHFMLANRKWGEQLGAYVDGSLVAIALAYPANADRLFLLHMMVTLPRFRGKGIGRTIAERLFANLEARGAEAVYWTYDPLDPANAHLYHNRLRGHGYRVALDYYGELHSAHHTSLPTHRLFCFRSLVQEIDLARKDKESCTLSVPITASEAQAKASARVSKLIDRFYGDLQRQLSTGYIVVGCRSATSAEVQKHCLVLAEVDESADGWLCSLGLKERE